MHNRYFLFLSFLGLFAVPWLTKAAEPNSPPTRDSLSFTQAWERVQQHNPDLAASRTEGLAAESRVRQASLFPNPELSLEVENFGGKRELRGFDGAEYTAQLGQTLELGGKRHQRIHVAKSERQLVSFDFASKLLDVRADTERRFIAVQGAQEVVALNRDSLMLAEEFVKAVSARVQAGKTSPLDREKALILLAQQKVALNDASSQLQTAKVQLSSLWGKIEPGFDRVAGDLQDLLPPPSRSAAEQRLTRNPDVARWGAEIEQRKAILLQEKAARAPDVTVSGGFRRFAEGGDNALVAGLSMPLPLLNRNQGKVAEAILLLEKSEYLRKTAETTAKASLIDAYQTLAVELGRIATLKTDVLPRSKAVFDGVHTGYTAGKFTYLDVLDARRTFFDVRKEYIEALMAGHNGRITVERLIGGASEPEHQ